MTTATNEITFNSEEEETKQNRFVEAKEISLYSQENINSKHNALAPKYKGICNAANPEQIFNVVGMGYKIAQHDEVYDAVEATVRDLGLKAKVKTLELDDGARLRMQLTFPDLAIKIGDPQLNDLVSFRMTFDNSYNATTGLRGMIDGERLACLNGMKVADNFSTYYHRHTKGLDVNALIPTIEKGIEVFQTKIKDKWESYYNTKIDPIKARNFLEQCSEDKIISQKYLEMMIKRMDFGGSVEIRGAGQITNQWMLYNLVTEILTHECDSIDTGDRFAKKMDTKINSSLKDLLAV